MPKETEDLDPCPFPPPNYTNLQWTMNNSLALPNTLKGNLILSLAFNTYSWIVTSKLICYKFKLTASLKVWKQPITLLP